MASNPAITQELGQLCDSDGQLIEKIKSASAKKSYKEYGKKKQAVAISKDAFLDILSKSNYTLNDDVIASIEPTVCLTLSQKDFYQVKYLEALILQV